MSNLPSMRARSPMTVSSATGEAAGLPFSGAGSDACFWVPF